MIVVVIVSCFFFFFKQKTAYEMRISDWSSDVCSSDLHRKAPAGRFFCGREPTTGSAPALALPNPESPTPNPRLPMINITLPDGSRREFDKPVSVMDVAQSIGPGLAKATVAGKGDGHLVDASDIIDHDAALPTIPRSEERRVGQE